MLSCVPLDAYPRNMPVGVLAAETIYTGAEGAIFSEVRKELSK